MYTTCTCLLFTVYCFLGPSCTCTCSNKVKRTSAKAIISFHRSRKSFMVVQASRFRHARPLGTLFSLAPSFACTAAVRLPYSAPDQAAGLLVSWVLGFVLITHDPAAALRICPRPCSTSGAHPLDHLVHRPGASETPRRETNTAWAHMVY